MVIVGGITRLTGSGLSMADWQPIMGVFPPMNEAEWNEKFELYKATPQFIDINNEFTLSEFKSIFWWEFIHRDLGRLIGLIFIIPFIIFWIQKRFNKPLLKKMFILLFLGSLQAILGWYMVYSGLIDKPYVSHFRLAAHFITALTVMSYILWIILDLKKPVPKTNNNPFLKKISLLLIGIILIQLTYGAFTAGLDAGFGNHTLSNAFAPPSQFGDILNHPFTVIFIHKYLGIFILLLSIGLQFFSKRIAISKEQTIGINILSATIQLQFLLGLFTLIYNIPIDLAVTHQAVGVLVLSACLYLLHQSIQSKKLKIVYDKIRMI